MDIHHHVQRDHGKFPTSRHVVGATQAGYTLAQQNQPQPACVARPLAVREQWTRMVAADGEYCLHRTIVLHRAGGRHGARNDGLLRPSPHRAVSPLRCRDLVGEH